MRFKLNPLSSTGVSIVEETLRIEQRGGNGAVLKGADGIGIPKGGTTGQVLKKASSSDYDTVWGAGGSGSSPLTTKGDIYTYSTADDRLPIGSNGQILSADSSQTTGLKWIPASSGSGITRSVNSVSATTSAGSTGSTDYIYLCNGTFTLTLPTAVGNTNLYTVKNVGTGTITIATTSAQTIDGSTVASIPVQYTSLDLISDGSNWNVV